MRSEQTIPLHPDQVGHITAGLVKEPVFRHQVSHESPKYPHLYWYDWYETYKLQFEDKGLRREDFEQFTSTWDIPSDVEFTRDPLTGFPQESHEDNVYKNFLLDSLANAIREDRTWAVVYCDGDNIKVANTISEPLGDLAIKYTAFRFGEAIERAGLSSQVKKYPARSRNAGDEFMFLLTDIEPDDITRLQNELARSMDSKITVNDPRFVFSYSATMLHNAYKDPDIQSYITETREFLRAHPDRCPTVLFDRLKKVASHEASEIKELKDLSRLPVEELLEAKNIAAFKRIMLSHLGNSRIGDKLLDVIMTFSMKADEAIKNNLPLTAAFIQLLNEMNVPHERIAQAKTTQQLGDIWREYFGPSSHTVG
ncbi:MAG TPA: GGDEF domain-containing protein [Candidatus Nitrosocosmicus sp.]|nr:GGDEF domain-containing protein [Candidatus Nitrosocosmicus sp.]